MGLADLRASREQSIEAELNADTMRRVESLGFDMVSAASDEVADQGVGHDDIATTTWLHLRYDGTDTALPIVLDEPELMRRDFEEQHRQRYGFISPEKKVFASAIEVEAAGGGGRTRRAGTRAGWCQSAGGQRHGALFFQSRLA